MKELTPEQEAELEKMSGVDPIEIPKIPVPELEFLYFALKDKLFMEEVCFVIAKTQFSCAGASVTWDVAQQYFQEFKDVIPEKFILDQLLEEKIKNELPGKQLIIKAWANEAWAHCDIDQRGRDYILKAAKKFAAKQHGLLVQEAFKKAVGENGNPLDYIPNFIKGLQEAMNIATNENIDDLNIQEILSLPDIEWLIEDHLPKDSCGIIYGKFGALKSFYALEMALSIAYGIPFLDHWGTKQQHVIYIAGEGKLGYKKRIQAWMKSRGIDGTDGKFSLICKRFNLCDDGKSVNSIIRHVKKKLAPGESVLIIFDTLARNKSGSDNDDEVMGKVIASMDTIKEAIDGSTVFAVHHAGKDLTRGARGSTALPAAMEVSIEVTRTEDGAKIHFEKQKDIEEIDDYYVKAEKIDIGDGKSSLVLHRATALQQLMEESKADKELEAFINKFPRTGPEALTLKQVMELFNLPETSARRIIKKAFERPVAPKLMVIGEGKSKNDPFRWYRV